jgi:hypothetical protein
LIFLCYNVRVILFEEHIMRFAPKSFCFKLPLKRAAVGISQREFSALLGEHPSPRKRGNVVSE